MTIVNDALIAACTFIGAFLITTLFIKMFSFLNAATALLREIRYDLKASHVMQADPETRVLRRMR